MRDDPALHVLVSIREDHLATIERLTAKMSVPFQARYRLDKLTTRSAKQAIEGPARASRLPFEAGVADTLVDDLALRRIDEFEEAIPDEFVEPGQLQVVCNRIWAKADADPANREPDAQATIRREHVEAAGGVEGALRRYYDDAVRSVTNGHKERRLRRFFEKRLITSRFTRQLVPVDKTSSKTERIPNAVLERLESEYGLVRKEQRGGTSYWELSHDGFVQPIRNANFEVWDRRRKKLAGIAWGLFLSPSRWPSCCGNASRRRMRSSSRFPSPSSPCTRTPTASSSRSRSVSSRARRPSSSSWCSGRASDGDVPTGNSRRRRSRAHLRGRRPRRVQDPRHRGLPRRRVSGDPEEGALGRERPAELHASSRSLPSSVRTARPRSKP